MALLDRTYGVEIECFAPHGLTREQCARDLTAIGIPAVSESYAAAHSVGATWKITTDGSLGDYTRGFEIKSPPLAGEAGFATIQRVSDYMRSKGFNVSKSCGLHVHVDIRRPAFPIEAMRRLAMLYVENEPLIDTTMPPSRRNSANTYARSVRMVSLQALSTARDLNSICDLMAGVSRGTTTTSRRRRLPVQSYGRKFFKLNFNPYNTYGTVEFRHHAGTIEGGKINKWVMACLRMVHKAATTPTAQVVADVSRTMAIARRGSKRAQVVEMLKRSEGCTTGEVLAATGWRQVSVAGIAHAYGLTLRQERVRQNGGWTTRYFATEPQANPTAPALTNAVPAPTLRRATSIDEFADMLGMTEEERKYWKDRATLFANATAAIATPTA